MLMLRYVSMEILMNTFIQNLEYYIAQYDLEKNIFQMGEKILNRGWMNKEEFLAICLWKSRRPKQLYNRNSSEEIIAKTKFCFSEKDEISKIQVLTELNGVKIPTASALLSVTNPFEYPIIDERCIQSLKHLGKISWTTITVNNWLEYLKVIRDLAKENNISARKIEKGLFAYNRIQLDKDFKNLYKRQFKK